MSHGIYSIVATLAIGVLGSTILPIPFAFAQTGIMAGTLTMLLVATVNLISCHMLIDACHTTGLFTYEELAEWTAGKRFKAFTQASLILLLFGTMSGGLAFLSDVTLVLMQKAMELTSSSSPSPSSPSGLFAWLLDHLSKDGRPLMVLTTLTILLPLCLQRRIIDSDRAATAGLVVVLALVIIIVSRAIRSGLPAIKSGDLDIFTIEKLDKSLGESFAVIGFAFYMQPMLLPLLNEMKGSGSEGVAVAKRATTIVLFGIALAVYWSVGVFGACLFGSKTESNIMLNDIAQGIAAVVLYICLLFYLSLSMVSTHFALRSSVDLLVFPGQTFTWRRHVGLTLSLISLAVLVALVFTQRAEKIFALTGSTAVCSVCYVIPVVIHLSVERRLKRSKGIVTADDRERAVSQEDEEEKEEVVEASEGGLSPSNSLLRPLIKRDSSSLTEGLPPSLSALPSTSSRLTSSPLPQRQVNASSRGGVERPRGQLQGLKASQWIIPVVILIVGVGCSAAGLYTAILDAIGLSRK